MCFRSVRPALHAAWSSTSWSLFWLIIRVKLTTVLLLGNWPGLQLKHQHKLSVSKHQHQSLRLERKLNIKFHHKCIHAAHLDLPTDRRKHFQGMTDFTCLQQLFWNGHRDTSENTFRLDSHLQMIKIRWDPFLMRFLNFSSSLRSFVDSSISYKVSFLCGLRKKIHCSYLVEIQAGKDLY